MALTKVKAGNILLTTPAASSNDVTPATTQYVTTALANMVDSAPSTLNTLNELAAALGDDANFSTTVTNSIATKLPLAGGSLTGNLLMRNGGNIEVGGYNSGNDKGIILTPADSASYWHIYNDAGGELVFGRNITIGSSEHMRIDQAGLVGIGQTNPQESLDVRGGDCVLKLDSTTNGSGVSWVKFADQGTVKWGIGLSKNSGNSGADFTFYEDAASGSPRLTIKDGGNVGIGTTSPTAKLDVRGGSGSGTHTHAIFTGTTGRGLAIKSGQTGGQHNGKAILDAQDTETAGASMDFQIGGNTKFAIDNTGNLSIGGTPSSGGSGSRWLSLDTPGANTYSGGHLYKINGTTKGYHYVENDFMMHQTVSGGGQKFYANASVAMILLSSGNVGIGTTSPTSGKLQVHGGGGSSFATLHLQPDTSTTFNHAINAFNSNLTNGENNLIVFGKEGSTKNSAWVGYKWRSAGSDTNQLTFGHWGNNNVFNILGNGYVGIGTESPGAPFVIQVPASAVNAEMRFQSGAYTSDHFKAYANQSGRFYIQAVSNTSHGVYLQYNATSWSSASDERLKENIVELENVLPKITNLRAVKYNFKADEENTTAIGFIAQDWQTDFSEVVSDSVPEALGMNYTETIPVLLKAIQEQQTIIEDLKTRIETLEG